MVCRMYSLYLYKLTHEEMIWPMFSINIQICYIVDLSEMVCFNKIINYLFIKDCPRCFSQELKINQMLAVRVTVYINISLSYFYSIIL